MEEINTPKLRNSLKRSLSVIEGILPFTEKPSSNHFQNKNHEDGKSEMEACDLFSLFTANIIKEEVVFTR